MSFLYGYCIAGTVPVRTQASDAAEMDTQLLLGECFEVLSITERWVQIRAVQDRCEGWVNRVQVRFLNVNDYDQWLHDPQKERSPYRTFLAINDTEAILVPFGAEVIFDDITVTLPNGVFEVRNPPILLKQSDILLTAEQFLGVPYLWGGRTDTGLDCSGFVQIVHHIFGFSPPRNSRAQAVIEPIKGKDIHQAKKGDLLYFGDSEDKISHVGFYLGEGTLLHASGHVKMDNLIYENRFVNPYPFDKRLFDRLQFVQDSSALKRNVPD